MEPLLLADCSLSATSRLYRVSGGSGGFSASELPTLAINPSTYLLHAKDLGRNHRVLCAQALSTVL